MKSKKLFLGVLIGLLVLAGIYVGGCLYFSDHFYLNSTINGVKSSGRSLETVQEAITEAARDYSIDIIDEGRGDTYTIFAEDVDMVTDVASGEVADILRRQSGMAWPAHIVERTEYETDHVVTMDPKKLKKEIKRLPCVDADDVVMTENARLEFTGERYEVIPEVFGTDIDVDAMTDTVMEKMEALQRSVGLLADQCYVQPVVFSDDEKLNSRADELNQLLAANITFTLDENVVLDKETQASFIKYDKKGNPVFDEEAIRAYVSTLAARVNTFGQPKTIKSSLDKKKITVPGGTYGWKVDEEAETEALLSDLLKGEDVTRELHYTYYANSHGKHDYGDTYVEVNITAQHLWLYKDGELVMDSDVVTGNPNRGNGTHVGAYYVAYKEKDAVLRGDDYATPVTYWMPFHGNEGLHDATWRGVFGGTIYRSNGSHGCVNCPFETAKTIFETIDEGCPVLVYATEEEPVYTVDPAEEEKKAASIVESIDIIAPVTLESETAIKLARSAYNSLSDNGKSLVTNIADLDEYERQLEQLKAEAEETVQKDDKTDSKKTKKKKKND
ncbi:MAG: L,D-transpeptidase/peptidoglycan binding protein [Lachnospiraceae bacterium]|nr:L,D-transpeptidase/peptidoglycan binding protein [Lachnospiraceae bacterium]